MYDKHPVPVSDRIVVAELSGAAQHYARWKAPDEATTAAAVAELREIVAGRDDAAALLAEVAGILTGAREGTPDEAKARNAAWFCVAAGADPELIPQWAEVGRERAARARMPPFGSRVV